MKCMSYKQNITSSSPVILSASSKLKANYSTAVRPPCFFTEMFCVQENMRVASGSAATLRKAQKRF